MAKNIIDEKIPNLSTSWENYKGSRVEEFIKSYLGEVDTLTTTKVGWLFVDSISSEAVDKDSGQYRLIGFRSQEDFETWHGEGYDPTTHENPGKTSLKLFDILLPIKEHTGKDYYAYLTTPKDSSNNYVVSNKSFEIPIRFSPVSRDSIGNTDSGSNVVDHGTITVQKSTDGGNTWATMGTTTITSKSYIQNPTSSDYEDSIDLGQYLSEGTQMIRLRASYQVFDNGALVGSATSNWISFVGITYTHLEVEFSDTSSSATVIDTSATGFSGKFPVSLVLHGQTTKTVHVEITNSAGEIKASTTQTVSAQTTTWSHEFSEASILTHGVHSVVAWLTCSDGSVADALESPKITSQRMVVDEATAGDNLYKSYIMLQNVPENAVNYTEVDDFLEYAVWVPSAGDPHVASPDSIGLEFIISSNSSSSLGTEYMRQEIGGVVSGHLYTLEGIVIEAESDESSLTGHLHVLSGGEDILYTSSGYHSFPILIDNEAHFEPTIGAVFFMNPKTRNNSEANPRIIYNEADSHSEVSSSFSGFSGISDLWVTSQSDHQHVLRILAGQSLEIEYDWLKGLENLSASENTSVTFEIDFKTSNVTNETSPIVQALAALGSRYIGIKLNPMTGAVCSRNSYDESSQNFHWQEDTRTHLAVNIISRMDLSGHKLPICRIFMNGVMVREFLFGSQNEETKIWSYVSDEWYNSSVPSSIILGQAGADIDIYAIRVYSTKGGSKVLDSTDILQNYISQLPTSEEKLNVKKENDIIDSTSKLVSLDKLKELKKNCLIWHGRQPRNPDGKDPSIGDTTGTNGYWEILKYDESGNLDRDHSGTICKTTGASHVYGLEPSRQGTTANSYFYSNIQTKLKDVEKAAKTAIEHDLWEKTGGAKGKQCTDPEKLENSRHYCITVLTTKIASDYSYDAERVYHDPTLGGDVILVPDGWFDANTDGDDSGLGYYHGPYYRLDSTCPLGQKLVLKINYASSMQSHLQGACRLYNALHTSIVGANSMQQRDSHAKVAKPQDAFHYFTQEQESEVPIFQGLGTFGPGKMDDPTWGYSKKKDKKFVMFEGADNNNPLTDFRVPYYTERVIENAHDKEGKLKDDVQSLDYDGKRNFDLDRFSFIDNDPDYSRTIEVDGTTAEAPSAIVLGIIKRAVNFLYLHNPMIKVYSGTWANFLSTSYAENYREYLWWCTTGENAWKLMRYDEFGGSGEWVNAGWDAVNEEFIERNLQTDPVTSGVYTGRGSKTAETLNSEIIQAIVLDAKNHFSEYFNMRSAIFHYAFVNSFIAGTDNCSKNTYYVIDPTTEKIELHQDDMDTIFATDNLGHQTKPYYIDRQNPYSDDDLTKSLYEGKNNVLFNLIELMYGDSGVGNGELQSMMREIFSGMISLVASDPLYETSIWGCLQKYFFSIQDYFSATAYNETAKIRYEYPTVIGFKDTIRGSIPITQSVGDQLEAEKQYMKRRLVLYASYATWGPFSSSTSGASGTLGILDADNGRIAFTSCANEAGERPSYVFHLVPHQYIYPVGFNANDSIRLGRCKPGVEVTLTLSNVGDQGRTLCGSNYYRLIGNLGDFCIDSSNNSQFSIVGKRLTEIHAEPTDHTSPNFRPGSLVINAPQLEVLSINGCIKTGGNLNLESCVRLKSIDLVGSSISNVIYPETSTLTTIHNPATLTSTRINNLPRLTEFTFEGYTEVTSLEWHLSGTSGEFNSLALIRNFRTAGAVLQTAIISGINWTSAVGRALTNATTTDYLASTKVSRISGRMQMTGNYMTYDRKNLYTELWGNIDDQNNSLYIIYPRNNVTDHVGIGGREFIFPILASESNGGKDIPATTYKYQITPYTTSGAISTQSNDIEEVTWGYSGYGLGNGNYIEASTGILHAAYTSIDTGTTHSGTVTATVTLYGGEQKTASYTVYFNKKDPQIGDYVYADGSWSSHYESDRTVVGICYYINPDAPMERLCVAPKSLGGWYWGLYNSADYMSGVTLDSDAPAGYQIYDLSNLQDIQSYPLVAAQEDELAPDETSDARYYTRDSNFRDGDDFKYKTILGEYTKTTKSANESAPKQFGYVTTSEAVTGNEANPSIWETGGIVPVGKRVPLGFLETLYIINHRNMILNHAVSRTETITIGDQSVEYQENISNDGLVVPTASPGKTEWEHLTELLQLAISKNSNAKTPANYRELYYPAASKAYAYSPDLTMINSYNLKAGETMNSMFKAHNWFLPPIGDLMRMYWYHRQSTGGVSGATYSKSAATTDPNAIFAKAYFEMGTTNGTRNFTAFPAPGHWSSTEYYSASSIYSWGVLFSSGLAYYDGKGNGAVVRPVAAF